MNSLSTKEKLNVVLSQRCFQITENVSWASYHVRIMLYVNEPTLNSSHIIRLINPMPYLIVLQSAVWKIRRVGTRSTSSLCFHFTHFMQGKQKKNCAVSIWFTHRRTEIRKRTLHDDR